MKVIIMRGIPGSGKSTWIKNHVGTHRLFSADKFFMKEDECGVMHYKFDVTQLATAHNWCLSEYTQHVFRLPLYPVVVDNTNIKVFEIAPYYRLAEAMGAEVEIVWCQCDPVTAIKRGVHGVPDNKVLEMWKSFEALPPWWNVRYVNTDEGRS